MQITVFSINENRRFKLGSRNRHAGSRHIRVASLTLLFLLLLAGSVALVHAETPLVFTLKWGSRGSGNGQLDNPCAIAVDGSGNVYVADTGNNRVQKFSSTGEYLTQWGTPGSGDGQFDNPCGIAVDASGNVYVGDTYNNRVQKFSSTGEYLTKFQAIGQGGLPGLTYPWGVAIDASGNVYVADSMNFRVVKFSSSGLQQGGMGTEGYGDGQLIYPRGIAVDASGNVYVCDSENHRVEKFSSTGVYQTQLGGTLGSGDGQFSTPYGVAVDGSGNVYVLDSYNHRVQKFSSTLVYQTQWGTWGEGDGQFNYPWGIAVDSLGNVYVADSSNYRIQKFSAPSSTPSPSATVHATTDSGGTVDLVINGSITISQMSNIRISTDQSDTRTTLSFTVTGESGTTGFSYITIPQSALNYGARNVAIPIIYIDDYWAQDQSYTQDSSNYYVRYAIQFSTHNVSIVFTNPNTTFNEWFTPPTTSPEQNNTDTNTGTPWTIIGIIAIIAVVIVVVVTVLLIRRRKPAGQTMPSSFPPPPPSP